LLWALALVGVISARKIGSETLFTLLLITSLIPTLIRQYPHYYIPAIAYASILASKPLEQLVTSIKKQDIVTIVFMLALLLPLPYYLATGYQYNVKSGINKTYIEVGEYITSKTAADEKILVIVKEPQFYFLAGRSPPNEYSMLGDAFSYPGIQDKMIRDALKRYMMKRVDVYVEVLLYCPGSEHPESVGFYLPSEIKPFMKYVNEFPGHEGYTIKLMTRTLDERIAELRENGRTLMKKWRLSRSKV